MGTAVSNILYDDSDKIEERKKICNKFRACRNDKLYKELLKSEGIYLKSPKKNKSKKLKKRYVKKHN